jgi:hypothetical protein
VAGKVVVVHAADNSKVGCGQITLDPWKNQVYSSDATGRSQGEAAVKQEVPVVGRVIVVHDSSMVKSGCGVIKVSKDRGIVAEITRMPGFTGDAAPTGTFEILQDNSALSISWDLQGLESSQVGMFHIHAGTSCENPGGHLENSAQMNAKITTFPGYTGGIRVQGQFEFGQAGSFISGNFQLHGLEQNAAGGYHIHAGTSCDDVGTHFMNGLVHAADIKPMPGYTGDLEVSGGFGFYQQNNAVRGQYALHGLPNGVSGRFHLHEGNSCDNVGGHLMNDPNVVHAHARRRLLAGDHPGDSVLQSEGDVVYDDADAKCSPCVEGETFSTKADSAICDPVTVCGAGKYVVTKPTVTTDTVCTHCTNGPAHSYYTTPGSGPFMNDCEFGCMEGYEKTNDGKNCAKRQGALNFQRNNGKVGLIAFDDNTLSIRGTCLDAELCHGKEQSKTITEQFAIIAATFCPALLESKQPQASYNPKGFFALDGGFCRYDCVSGCQNARPFDQTSDFAKSEDDQLDHNDVHSGQEGAQMNMGVVSSNTDMNHDM